MKVACGRILRNVAMLGLVTIGAAVTGCGDDSSNPEAVDVNVLKGPGDLKIRDNGNGSVTLTWSAGNNEDDFDGFNVYGMKGEAKDFDLAEGESLQLQTAEGEASETAREILSKFNYDPDKGLEEKGKTEASTEGDDAPKYSALPIHTENGKDRLLPTCKNDGAGVCTNTTKDNVGKSVEDSAAIATNGPISYTVTGLTVGSSYCFLVMSSIDEGAKISAASSELRCIVPKYMGEVTLDLPGSGENGKQWLLEDYQTACAAADECEAPTAAVYKTGTRTAHKPGDDGPLYIEYSSSTVNPALVAGKNSAIADIGYYPDGFADADLPEGEPTLVLDTNTYGTGVSESPIFNTGGFSVAGQSVYMEENHIYVVAVGDPDSETAVSDFTYVWLWVKSAIAPDSTDVTFEVRMPK